MDELKAEQFCLENKQSDVTSSCSVSEGSCGAALKSPGVCSPGTTSPSHRRTTGPIRRAKGGWTLEEDETLRNAVQVFKGKCWKKIAEFFPDRSEVQCLHRWQKVLNPELIKGPWTQEEDDKIIELVSKYGPTKWSVIAKSLPGRIGKQCRERLSHFYEGWWQVPCQKSGKSRVRDLRAASPIKLGLRLADIYLPLTLHKAGALSTGWHNHLNPMIKKDAWTLEEELLLLNAQRVHGNKWAEIAKVLPGRTDNSIKNHWNSSLKKKLDFYLATGQLPPAPKIGQNGAKDISRVTATGNFFTCSNKGSDSAAERSLADICKMEKDPRDHLESLMQQCLDMDTSTSELVIGPDDGVACKPQVATPEERGNCGSDSDFTHSNYDSTPISIKCRNNRESYQDMNIAGTPLEYMVPAFGSSYHESPLSENYDIPLDSTVSDTFCPFQQTNDPNFFGSPRSSSAPPCAKGTGLGWQIAESILKNAAQSFPNTPSILRKRKRDTKADGMKIKDSLHTPEQAERTENKQDQSGSINSSLCESSVCNGTVGLCSGRGFNASPPYRLRSKRTAVFKSIEKQLDFTSDKDRFDSSNQSMNVTIKGNTHVAENCPQTMKMGVT